MNVDIIAMFIRGHGFLQILPPPALVEHPFFGNETKPWGKQQGFVGHHFDQFFLGDPLDIIDFVGMRFHRQGRLVGDAEKQDVIDFVFSPGTVVVDFVDIVCLRQNIIAIIDLGTQRRLQIRKIEQDFNKQTNNENKSKQSVNTKHTSWVHE